MTTSFNNNYLSIPSLQEFFFFLHIYICVAYVLILYRMLLTTPDSYHMLSIILNLIQNIHEIIFKMIYKELNLTERELIKVYLKIQFSGFEKEACDVEVYI